MSMIKSASRAEKQEMRAIVEALNDGAYDDDYWSFRYELGRARDQWTVIVYDNETGEIVNIGCFYRCAKCGSVREYFEGQVEECWECGAPLW